MNVPGLAECAHVERVIEAVRDDEAAPLAEGLAEHAKVGDGLSARHDLSSPGGLESKVHHADPRAALGEGDDGSSLGRGDLEANLRRDPDVADLLEHAMDLLNLVLVADQIAHERRCAQSGQPQRQVEREWDGVAVRRLQGSGD